MSNVIYDPAKIEATIQNASVISTNITSLTENVSSQINALDSRVYSYFSSFCDLKNSSKSLNDEIPTVDSFKNWMTDTYADYNRTRNQVGNSSGKGANADITPGEEIQFRTGDIPVGTPTYEITAEAWDNLSTEDKKVIEAKLKELGFTDEEIQKIKDGNAVVNKTVLDKLSTELTKLNNNGSDVRQVILEKYGFDIFNEDGTINKDKLALALLIDGKNANDDYDLVALLKNKYGIDLFPPEPTTTNPHPIPTTPVIPTTPTEQVIPPSEIDSTTPQSVHTGVGYGGSSSDFRIGAGASFDTSEIENMLDGTEDDSLLDGLGNLSGSLLGGKKGFNIGKIGNSKGTNAFGIATSAGLAGLSLAATAGILAKKKREKELVDGEDEFDDELDDDDDLDLRLDEEELLDNSFDESSILSESATEDTSSDTKLRNAEDKFEGAEKKKQWLYGLGIGLAGAGIAAALGSKDDDDDDDDDYF